MRRLAVGSLLSACLAIGSIQAAGPEFEVASVRPSPQMTPELIQSGRLRKMNIDGGRVDIAGMPLSTLIPLAFRVPQGRVHGPDWMTGLLFDIQAKLPAGASEDQVPEMLQALLADRFKMVVHRENKEQAGYELVVTKGGVKVKPSEPEADASPEVTAADPNTPPDPSSVMPLGGGSVRVTDEPGGRGGTISGARTGTVRATMGADGTMRMEAPNITFEGLADLLTQLIRQPVMDATGLTGRYQIILDMPGMAPARAAPSEQSQSGAGGPAASTPDGGPIFAAVQKLGLKLEPRKIPLEVIVVDRLEKTPTEN
jgi:uncharacterized protein (TIGR03435 family)